MERSHGVKLNTVGGLVTLVLGFVLGLVAAWLYWWERRERGGPAAPEQLEPIRVMIEPGGRAPQTEPHDLTRIEGIGPKISSVLQDAGIRTFQELAESEPARLEQILREDDERLARLADPTTWPEQAVLAAAGAWDVLSALQEELTAGRRR